MKRIVVLGQPGGFGDAWSRHAAARLAQRLDLPCLAAAEEGPSPGQAPGWVTTARVGELSGVLLRDADTAVWLHFLPVAVTRAWLRRLRAGFARTPAGHRLPGFADVRDSLVHMAWTPHVHRLLSHPALSHLQVFHLRSPDETDFWLRAQEHRLPDRQPPLAQPA
ncbi:MAG: hypothetical protein IPM30_07010 [Burkholderiales bacterium]|jgi:hypothetical protein|nr:hypothetical protein [Burkholderiales bacterium]